MDRKMAEKILKKLEDYGIALVDTDSKVLYPQIIEREYAIEKLLEV